MHFLYKINRNKYYRICVFPPPNGQDLPINKLDITIGEKRLYSEFIYYIYIYIYNNMENCSWHLLDARSRYANNVPKSVHQSACN